MRRLLSLLTVVAAIPAIAGCGSKDLPSVSVADAAQTTREAQTARMTLRVELRGMGLPRPTAISAEGVTRLDSSRMDITVDLGSVLAEVDGDARTIVDGARVYVDPPDVQNLDLPGNATWVVVDLRKVAEAAGFDPEAIGELLRMSPRQQLDALDAAGSVEKVGEDEVDGVRTTHLRGTISLRDYAEGLPPDRRRKFEAALRKLARISGEDVETIDEPTPTEMWVDEDAHIRRMTQKSTVPAQEGVPAGAFTITTEFTDFGTPLELDPPEGGDVVDMTGDIVDAIRDAF